MRSVKEILAREHGFPLGVRLVHGGRILVDDATLADAGILCGDTIHALIDPHYFEEVDLDQIHRICPLPHFSEPSDEQRHHNADASLVASFICSASTEHASWTWRPAAGELRAMQRAVAALTMRSPAVGAPPHVTWYGPYGCVLLACMTMPGMVQLELLGLDEWTLHVHSGPGHRTQSSRPAAHMPVSMHTGAVPLHLYPKLLDFVEKLLAAARARTAEKRSAATKTQGHSKTPAMVQAVLQDAINSLGAIDVDGSEGITPPLGGYTDVGMHTGGAARATAWPLMRAVLQTVIEAEADDDGGHSLGRLMMAQFHLRLAESSLARLPAYRDDGDLPIVSMPHNEFTAQVNAIMCLLSCAVTEATELSDAEHFDLSGFEARCVLVRFEVEKLVSTRARARADPFILPRLHGVDVLCRNATVVLSLPATVPAGGQGGTLEDAKGRASANANPLPVASELSGFSSAHFWLERFLPVKAAGVPRTSLSDAAALLALITIETFIFSAAADRLRTCCGSDRLYVLSGATVERLLEDYLWVSRTHKKTAGALSLLVPEQLSRELLCVWACVCMLHQHMKMKEPLLRDYSLPLDPDDLSHLVLSDKLAVDAARGVVGYLRTTGVDSCIFSLSEGDATINFARRRAQADEAMKQLWEKEKAAAELRREAHWQTVLEKYNVVMQLDEEKAELDEQVAEWQTKLDRTDPPKNYRYGGRRRYDQRARTPEEQEYDRKQQENDRKRQQATAELQYLKCEIDSNRQRAAAAEKPPDGIKQPLPLQESEAMPIIFFLMMPRDYQALSRLCFTAQQMLLPESKKVHPPCSESAIDVDMLIAVEGPKLKWSDYYLTKSSARELSSLTDGMGTVVIGTMGEAVGENGRDWFPRSVRDPEFELRRTGVWYPDRLTPVLFWSSSGFAVDVATRPTWYNPYQALPRGVLVDKFTGHLAKEDHSLQWAMEQHGRERQERGNWPEARQAQRPMWISQKPEHLAFGTMRAYPRQQIRKLLSVLHDRRQHRSLPLETPAVRLLLRQTLYQLGEISKDDNLTPIWRRDLDEHGGWDVLRAELESLVEQFRNKPREHGAVLILGEIAAHASQWDAQSRDVARKYAAVARDWADCERFRIETAEPGDIAVLRARCCLFCMYAIVCHGAGELSDADAKDLCELVVLAEHHRLYDDETELDERNRELTIVTNAIMARRLPLLLVKLDRNAGLLTGAVQLVLASQAHAASKPLKWAYLHRDQDMFRCTCYQSISGDKLFTINVHTGVVLYNGLPPHRLPTSILEKPLYKQTFGDCNFEVVSANGVLKTIRPFKGRNYAFLLNVIGGLHVTEIEPACTTNVGLTLDLLEDVGNDLPVRLRTLHSHWYCRDGQHHRIILRPHRFDQRDVSFILGPVDCTDWTDVVCYRIPEHLRRDHWAELCERSFEFDQLKIPCNLNTPVLRTLRKFETDGDVHVYSTPNDTLLFELPRYQLAFELNEGDGQLRSKNFLDYSLTTSQQLSDTLHDFEQYLILKSSSQTRMCVQPPTRMHSSLVAPASDMAFHSCAQYHT